MHKVIFYNHFGAGDLHESREFVRDIMSLIPADKYYYAHGKHPKMLSDIPNLEYIEVTPEMNPSSGISVIDDNMYINTWIGRDSRYVLPQIGCVIDMNYLMFNDMLRPYGLSLSKLLYDYLPEIDFAKFDIDNIDRYYRNYTGNSILICNGVVQSMQAENFDFSRAIYELAIRYKDLLFITTAPIEYNIDNVILSSEIIKNTDGNDLNEIAYLSLFCDLIVGRKSGPFVCSHTKQLWFSQKGSLSFTYAKHSSHFVLQDNVFPLKKYWSNAVNPETVYQVISSVIEERKLNG